MRRPVLVLVVFASLTTGCSDSSGTSGEPRLDRLEISLVPGVTSLMVNDTARAGATGFSQRNVPYPIGPVAWRSSDPSVAAIDQQGLVQGQRRGSAFVVATVGEVKDSIHVSVAGTLHASTITSSEVWTLADAPHGVRGQLQVGGPGGATLTLENGVTVLFESNAGVTFGLNGVGSLLASGSAAAPVTLKSADTTLPPGSWIGLTFRGTTRSELHHVAMSGCGGTRNDGQPAGCVVVGHPFLGSDPTLLVESVTIDLATGAGMILQGESRFDSGSSFLSVHDVQGPIAILPAAAAAAFPLGGSFAGNNFNEIQLVGDTIRESATWVNAGAAWSVLGTVLIEGPQGPVLTIPAGQTLQMAFRAGFIVGEHFPGGLIIGSSGGAPVSILTADANGWDGIGFWPQALPSSIRGAVLDNCGSSHDSIYGQGCVFFLGNFGGTGAAPVLEDVTISNGINAGVGMVGGGRFGAGSDNVTITGTRGSPGAPISTNASSVGSVPPGQYTGNVLDAIWSYATEVTTTETWSNRGIPYFFRAGVLVGGAASPLLTITPGVVLQFAPGTLFWVGALAPGTVRAVGTSPTPIVFTGQFAFAGSWMGVEIGPFAGPTTLLDHVTVDYGGADDGIAAAGIRIAKDQGAIVQNTLIRNSAGCGIARMGTGPWLTDFTAAALGNTFQNNAGLSQCDP